MAQREEPVDVPAADVVLFRIDVNGEVEEVGDGDAEAAIGTGARRLENIETFDDQHVGALHDDALARNSVVRDV